MITKIIDLMSDDEVYEFAKALAPHIKKVIPTMTPEELDTLKNVCARPDFDAGEMRTFLKKLYGFAVKHTQPHGRLEQLERFKTSRRT